ncbi:MAG TPA: enoyl-CoA hydratase-related protein [Balneolaceae bacterium]
MSQIYKTIIFETDDRGIATVQINRPEKLNALNDEVLNELAEVFKAIQVDKEITAVIVTGSGEKAFVAGADIKELRELNKRSGRMTSQKGQQIFQLIEDSRVPVIAAVNGYALGGGAELAMACHLRIAGKNAVFGLPEVGLGLIPGYGGTQRLSRIVGRARALEMILTGKPVKAVEAHQMGLVNEVTDENPVDAARKLLEKILKNGPVAIRSAIKAIYHSDYRKGYQVEADLFGGLCETEDFVEGTSAFLEKRKPEFKGS